MGVKERKALEKQIRRNQILDAARTLLFSSGINGISISRISKISELGVGTIYFYYKNKEEIFVALQEEGLELLYSTIFQISKKEFHPEKILILIALSYYRFSEEQKNYFEIINYFLSSTIVFFEPDLKNKIDRSGSKIFHLIEDIVVQGVQKNVFNEEDPQKFSMMYWATLQGLIHFKKLEGTILEKNSYEKLYSYSVQKLVQSLK